MTFEDRLSRDEIMECIKDEEWQELRLSLKGTTTERKVEMLVIFKTLRKDRCATIVVQNYVNALKRGGQIK